MKPSNATVNRARSRRSTVLGFTVLELVIVIGIILTLYAIISPAIFSARARGRETACASNLRQIGLALQMYHEDDGDYPNFRPADQMVATGFVKSPSIFVCPSDPRQLAPLDPSDHKTHYPSSYYWPCIPNPERDLAIKRRGPMTPLVFCAVHAVIVHDEYHYIILRADGHVDRVPLNQIMAAQSNYDY